MSMLSSRREFLKHSAAAGALTLGGVVYRDACQVRSPAGYGHSPMEGAENLPDIAVKLTDMEALGAQRLSAGGNALLAEYRMIARLNRRVTNPYVVEDVGTHVGCRHTVKVETTLQSAETYMLPARVCWRRNVFLDPNRYRDMDIGGERLKMHLSTPRSTTWLSCSITKHHSATKMTKHENRVLWKQLFHQTAYLY